MKLVITADEAVAAGDALQRWYQSQDMDDGKFVAVAAFLVGKLIARHRLGASDNTEGAMRDLASICSTMVEGMIAELDKRELG